MCPPFAAKNARYRGLLDSRRSRYFCLREPLGAEAAHLCYYVLRQLRHGVTLTATIWMRIVRGLIPHVFFVRTVLKVIQAVVGWVGVREMPYFSALRHGSYEGCQHQRVYVAQLRYAVRQINAQMSGLAANS